MSRTPRPGAKRNARLSAAWPRAAGACWRRCCIISAAGACESIGEYNTVRQGNVIRLDHSLCFRHALDGLSPEAVAAVTLLGYEAQDFQSRYFEHAGPRPIWVFSNWADLGCPIYRHIETGVRIPYKPPKPRPVKTDAMIRVEGNLGAYFRR